MVTWEAWAMPDRHANNMTYRGGRGPSGINLTSGGAGDRVTEVSYAGGSIPWLCDQSLNKIPGNQGSVSFLGWQYAVSAVTHQVWET